MSEAVERAKALAESDLARIAASPVPEGESPPDLSAARAVTFAPDEHGAVKLIWTRYGHLPIDSLRYETAWHDEPDYVKFVERYFLGDELVKESAHVLARQGAEAHAAAGQFGGPPAMSLTLTSLTGAP